MSTSPVLFLQDTLYREKNLLERAVPHFLGVTQEHHGLLHALQCKYHNVFSGYLPKKVPPNRKLGDVHSILLEPSTEAVKKRSIPS